jgi:hypothetical protein
MKKCSSNYEREGPYREDEQVVCQRGIALGRFFKTLEKLRYIHKRQV